MIMHKAESKEKNLPKFFFLHDAAIWWFLLVLVDYLHQAGVGLVLVGIIADKDKCDASDAPTLPLIDGWG